MAFKKMEAGESTTIPRAIAEVAVAHLVGDEVERAYRRSDALEKLRALMKAWASFRAADRANVLTRLPARQGHVQ
jgi:hypothetical protein